MPNFILAYHDPKMPSSQEEGAKHMEKWKNWVKDLGDALITAEAPLGKSQTVSATGISEEGRAGMMMGYSVLKAESMDAALKIAQSCPFVEMGTIEVAEIRQM